MSKPVSWLLAYAFSARLSSGLIQMSANWVSRLLIFQNKIVINICDDFICWTSTVLVRFYKIMANWEKLQVFTLCLCLKPMEPYREIHLKVLWVLHSCREEIEHFWTIFFSLPPVDLHFFLVISCNTLYLKRKFHVISIILLYILFSWPHENKENDRGISF